MTTAAPCRAPQPPAPGATAIRAFRAQDLPALYTISLATGHAGGDASGLYRDPHLVGQIYSVPYGVLAPDLVLVAEDDAGVAGFALGAIDTTGWEALLERHWWPALRHRHADPGPEPAAGWSPDQRRAFAIHHPTLSPAAVCASHPTHLHLNLLPRLQHRGVGSALLRAWLALARGRGARCVHVAVNRANTGAIGFWTAKGFRPLDAPPGRALYLGRDAGQEK